MYYFVLNIKVVILKRIFWELFHPFSQYWNEIFPPKFHKAIFKPKNDAHRYKAGKGGVDKLEHWKSCYDLYAVKLTTA